MQTLKNDNNMKTDPREWIARLGIPAAIGFGIYLLLPFLTNVMTDLTAFLKATIGATLYLALLVVVGLVVGLPILYAITNPMVVWMKYRALCRKFTGWIVKLDPISFMESYIELLKKKLKNLRLIITDLVGNKIQLEREVDELKKSANAKMRLAKAAKELGDNEEAAHQSSMAQQEIESVNLFTPILSRFNINIANLQKLEVNWGRSIEKLSFTVERKKKEWQMLEKAAKAYGAAEEFANGETEASQLYFASIKALEEKVSSSMAYIEEFERNTKGKMKAIDLEKAVSDDEGMTALEKYMETGNLFLSEDFADFEIQQHIQKGGKNLFAKGSANKSAYQSSFGQGTSNKSNEFDSLIK